MTIKFNAVITIDLKSEKPRTEQEWESFCADLEKVMEIALENNDSVVIDIAEVVMEEI